MLGLELWIRWYRWIAETMGYIVDEDQRAAFTLAHMLRNLKPPISHVKTAISGRNVIVFGAGPSLDTALEALALHYPFILEDSVLIAADGASQALIERGLTPDIVVTDLDGGWEAIRRAAEAGATLVIHAHGDNIGALEDMVPRLLKITSRIIGTTQVKPEPPIYNFGGFTDGDRAVFLASHFGASRVLMVGMDFGRIVGKRSKPWLGGNVEAGAVKEKKLIIAYRLISWLASISNTKIYTLSERAPPGTIRISLKNLRGSPWCSSHGQGYRG